MCTPNCGTFWMARFGMQVRGSHNVPEWLLASGKCPCNTSRLMLLSAPGMHEIDTILPKFGQREIQPVKLAIRRSAFDCLRSASSVRRKFSRVWILQMQQMADSTGRTASSTTTNQLRLWAVPCVQRGRDRGISV